MRTISLWFTLVFVVEFMLLFTLLSWSYNATRENELERVKTCSQILTVFGSLLLTTGLVYHNFWQHPELRIMDIMVDPVNADLKNIAEKEYKNYVFVQNPKLPGGFETRDQTRPKKSDGFLEVKSTRNCPKIRVSTDVCNVGVTETTIHDYEILELKPIARIIGVYTHRKILPHQRRSTLEFYYPDDPSAFLKSGEYQFRITVRASTQSKTKTVKIVVSDDTKSIKWQQLDC